MGSSFAYDPDAAIARIGACVLWVIALWFGAGLLATVVYQTGARERRIAGAISRVLLPAAFKRMLAGAVGVGVALSPAMASAAPAASVAASATSAAASPAPLWPVDTPRTATADAAPLWPVNTDARAASSSPRRIAGIARVTVQPGDSLWSIARHELGGRATPARTTQRWHEWFEANRHVIGDDPSLIHPGQTLHAPEETS